MEDVISTGILCILLLVSLFICTMNIGFFTLCVASSGFLFLPMDALISGIPRFRYIRKRVIACYFLDKI